MLGVSLMGEDEDHVARFKTSLFMYFCMCIHCIYACGRHRLSSRVN